MEKVFEMKTLTYPRQTLQYLQTNIYSGHFEEKFSTTHQNDVNAFFLSVFFMNF